MKTKMVFFVIVFVIIQAIGLLICGPLVYAWTGEPPFGPISRETILRRASEMINFSWSPLANISNQCSLSEPRHLYSSGTVYKGAAYNRYNNPVDDWSQFYPKVNSVSCTTPPCLTSYGTECSGFVSISWKLPKRYNTSAFECDATDSPTATGCGQYKPSLDNYVSTLGAIGSGKNVRDLLLPGDAFVRKGSHILLFDGLHDDPKSGVNDGILALEQTPPYAIRNSFWSWQKLSTYRPIRRNKIDEQYKFVTKWGSQGAGNGQFSWPNGLAIDSSGHVYVADTENDRVQQFTSDGVYQKSIKGTVEHPILGPAGVAVDSSGYLYIVGNARVLKFTSDGNYFTEWGLYGSWDGGFLMPADIALDLSGNIYVSDADLDTSRVQKFTNTGTFLTKWGSYGTGNGQFDWPSGVAVDSSGFVYVADSGNNRIQKFDGNGVFKWSTYGGTNQQLSYPGDVAVDAAGYIYVADTDNHRILKFDNQGNYIMQWGSHGTSDGQFASPHSIGVDPYGQVYVLEGGLMDTPRIQKFAPVSPQPGRPTSPAAKAILSNKIDLTWSDNSDNETGFFIRRKIGIRGPYSDIAFVGANVTNYADTTVAATDIYCYAVYAYNSYGNSAYSDETSASNLPSPADLKATSASSTKINLAWTDNSTDETSFKIYRKTGTGAWGLLYTTAADAVSYSDITATGNTSATSYSYYIKTCKNTICSLATKVSVVPYSPANLTTIAGPGKIDLTWTDASTNEKGFQIQRKPGGCVSTSTWSIIATKEANTISHSNSGLTSGTTYSYRIRSYARSTTMPYAYGYSLWSNCTSATTP